MGRRTLFECRPTGAALGRYSGNNSEQPFRKLLFTVIFEIITFLIQKHFKTVTVNGNFEEINSNDFLDGNWESMEMKGLRTAGAKTVTVMVIHFLRGNFRANKFSRVTRLPVRILSQTVNLDIVSE